MGNININININILCFIILSLSLTFHTSSARHAKNQPSAVVVGKVYCDTCFRKEFSKNSHLIHGASIAVECEDLKQNLSFRRETKTDGHGTFRVRLPTAIKDHIKSCSVKLITSSDPFCAIATSTKATSLNLKSKTNGVHVFSAGFFSFKPLKQPEMCDQKPEFSQMKTELPQFPPLPPLPTLPKLPQLPHLLNFRSQTEKPVVSAPTYQKEEQPASIPTLPSPPTMPNPFQLPSFLPNPLQPNPLQPPVLPNPLQPPVLPNPLQPPPALPNPLQPPPALPNPLQPPPTSFLPPNPFRPPSPPPAFGFPPFAFPTPFPPSSFIPGAPPAIPSEKKTP
ncbi:hypothetical protein QJS10_CPB15g01609 [Acorus calamus]|uniref:Uncharacterized protein n=1 Tax=Acorus calamus TaxID=4465 RepID=A0AAV9D9A8_ACOCL|nr:hypothetical protein QJS10_CPB15g01609 [Acorus calamus]